MDRANDVGWQAKPTYGQQHWLEEQAVRTTDKDLTKLPGWMAAKVRIKQERAEQASVNIYRASSQWETAESSNSTQQQRNRGYEAE